MNPVKLLIKEHITITKMIELLSFLNLKKLNTQFLEKIIDFFFFYVDKCHHGKEEKILFQKLKSKNLKKDDADLMNELIEEHKMGRKLVKELNENKSLKNPEKVKEIFSKMITLYRAHIDKENTRFFYPAFNYFTQKEKEIILQDFFDLDKNIIHEKYQKVVEELENSLR